MQIPEINPDIFEISKQIAARKKQEEKKRARKEWLSTNIVAILALIVSIISLIRTF